MNSAGTAYNQMPYANLNIQNQQRSSGTGPVLSQSMDQSFLMDANNVLNAMLQNKPGNTGGGAFNS